MDDATAEAILRTVAGQVYAADYSALTVAQRRVLGAMTAEPATSPTAADYLSRHRLPAKSTTSQALRSLLEKGYLETQGDTCLVSDPLFAEWLRRQLGDSSAHNQR